MASSRFPRTKTGFPRRTRLKGETSRARVLGIRDSAVSWAIILPLYWYCEKGAAVA